VVSVNGIDARAIHDAHGFDADVLGFSFAARPSPADFAMREGIAFLGALYGTDTPNYDSLVWFIEEILPLIDKKIPGIQFHVAGYVDRQLPAIKTKLGDQINWLGEVSDLDAFFGAARVFVAPTRFAGGVPHKVANAAAHGLPAVVTPLLARQLNDDSGENYFLSPADISAAAFADCVVRLYQEPDLWADFRAKGLRHAGKFYCPEDFVTKVRDLIGG
jgi:glycosyltransferase involved in cell wall biosynthesis